MLVEIDIDKLYERYGELLALARKAYRSIDETKPRRQDVVRDLGEFFERIEKDEQTIS